MTTETLAGRARNALEEIFGLALCGALVFLTVGLGTFTAELPVPATVGFALGLGTPFVYNVRTASTRADVRAEQAEAGLLAVIFIASSAHALAPPGVLEGVTALALGVTVAVAGTSFYMLVYDDSADVPYLSHYVETGAWAQ